MKFQNITFTLCKAATADAVRLETASPAGDMMPGMGYLEDFGGWLAEQSEYSVGDWIRTTFGHRVEHDPHGLA